MDWAFDSLERELKGIEKYKLNTVTNQHKKSEIDRSFDPLIACMLIFDGLLAAGVVYLLRPSGKPRAMLDRAILSRRLSLLDKRIDSNPDSTRYRGVRAKLRAEMGLHEEAIEDIDWILEKEPRGVDLAMFSELRDSLTDEIEAEKENVDEKQ